MDISVQNLKIKFEIEWLVTVGNHNENLALRKIIFDQQKCYATLSSYMKDVEGVDITN